MNASSTHVCQRCAARLPDDSAETLCPACLLSGALHAPDSAALTVSLPEPQAPRTAAPVTCPGELGGYTLLGELGRGGMGTVYEALRRDTGRRLALKVLAHTLDTPEMRARFLREGRLAARVNHPNSLYVFGCETIGNQPVITMEIADGGTLQDRLVERGPLPVGEAVDALLGVVSGLEAAAQCGVLHRDIKPSNCFVGPDGSVKIGDYGLSVSTVATPGTFATAPDAIMGTPAFAAPEQLRGDDVDLRTDIYAVGATLFTLLTGRPPFTGDNAVQVVAHALHDLPPAIASFRTDVPAELARVVARCLARDRAARFPDYAALRQALWPFSTHEPQPAPLRARIIAGWVDYLLAFLPPYLVLMFTVGAEDLLVRPLVEPGFYALRYHAVLLACGVLYFALAEGVWGAGPGKAFTGLRVTRPRGRVPGIGRAALRVLIPVMCCEIVRLPVMMALISRMAWTPVDTTIYVIGAIVCGWIPALMLLRACSRHGGTTLWDRVSGTRVVVAPTGAAARSTAPPAVADVPRTTGRALGPYDVTAAVAAGRWVIGTDPILRRRVWLVRRSGAGPSRARRVAARPGRLRWLQAVENDDGLWDAYEGVDGGPWRTATRSGNLQWMTLRRWLHDAACEIYAARDEQTLPATLSLDNLWITGTGRIILLDDAWPDAAPPAERIPVDGLAGQQRFLHAMTAQVDPTTVPLHARAVLRNLENGTFASLCFLTGTLRGLCNTRAAVNRGLRAGALLMIPLYVWIALFVGRYHDKPWAEAAEGVVVVSVVVILGAAVVQLLAVPFRSTVGHSTFGLAIINAEGEPATRGHLLLRWAIAWLPLLVPLAVIAWTCRTHPLPAIGLLATLMVAWTAAALRGIIHPRRGLHDVLAGTWVVVR